MYKKILVPVDGSASSLNALKEAMRIAKFSQATIELLYVVDITQFSWGGSHLLQSKEAEAAIQQIGQNKAGAACTILEDSGINYHLIVLPTDAANDVAVTIINILQQFNCDLLVMGTHGFTGLMHLLLGSVAEKVLRLADNIPIILVPN